MNNNDILPALDIDNEIDDCIDTSMDMYNSYQAMDFVSLNDDTSKLIDKFVKGVTDLYIGEDIIDDYPIVSAMVKFENRTMSSLIKQFKYGEHALESMVRMIDSGGFMDRDNFEVFIKLQQNAMDITLKVSQYMRNFPLFMKHIEEELEKNSGLGALENKINNKVNNKNMHENAEDVEELEEFDVAGEPRMGTRDMLKEITEELEIYNSEIGSVDTIRPDYIETVDEDDDM